MSTKTYKGPLVITTQDDIPPKGWEVLIPSGCDVGVLVRLDHADLRGLHIVGGCRTAIQIEAEDVTLDDLSIEANCRNTPREEGHPIQFRHGSGRVLCCRIVRWKFLTNRPGQGEDGINLWHSKVEILRNKIYGYGLADSGNSITVDEGSEGVIHENKIWHPGKRGIVVASGRATITRNELTGGSLDAGIAVQECYPGSPVREVVIEGNVFRRIRGRNIWIDPKCREAVRLG